MPDRPDRQSRPFHSENLAHPGLNRQPEPMACNHQVRRNFPFEFRALAIHCMRSAFALNGPAASEFMKRTHHCNDLRPAHIGQTVTLCGWVHSRRDLGGLIFIDVRDREGRTQTVFDPSELSKELFEQAGSLRSECVISVTGKVRQRPSGTNNSKIPTGEVEVGVTALELLNFAEVLPFPVDDPEIASKVNEE